MADDVAVTDILCEAMEYLAKLGANLRSRSENLKEKRIRKDRLKNSHAVHKAAQKVLTICELSKKSLDNVETGVKKILSAVSAAQASIGDGGKTTKRDSTSSRPSHSRYDKPSSDKKIDKHLSSPKSVYVSGKKYVLKFPRKVNVKHYQSVKVMARAMPKSCLEDYPVYLNCKLYRARERKALKNANSTSRSSLDSKPDKIDETQKTKTLDEETENKDSNGSNDLKEAVTVENTGDDLPLSKHYDDGSYDNNISRTNSKKREHGRKQSTVELSDSDSPSPNITEKEKKKGIYSKEDVEDSTRKSTNKKDKPKKLKRIIVNSSDSEQDDKNMPNESKNGKSDKLESDEASAKDVPSEKSSENKNIENAENSDETHSNNTSKEKPPEKEDDKINPDEDKNVDEVKETESIKPLIKCVSLTKLLKPDILVKETKSTDQQPESVLKKDKSKKMVVHMNEKGEVKTKFIDVDKNKNLSTSSFKQKSKKASVSTDENKEELARKAKQLADFKPKNFIIKVIKLPTLSVEFLKENNLQRITQNGSVITEISTDTSNKKVDSDEEMANDKITNDTSQVIGSKNALLSDSDCEKSPENLEKNTENKKNNDASQKAHSKCTNEAKNALLNDSDAEKSDSSQKKCDENGDEPKSQDMDESEKIKKSLLNDSESDKNDEDNQSQTQKGDTNTSEHTESISNKASEETSLKSKEDTSGTTDKENNIGEEDKELAKSSLLNDSSDSNTKSPDKKIKGEDGGPKSRRKHMMESMHAKKMLLTYSSSSDTEDEQLKSAIKNIKDNLLKDIEMEDKSSTPLKKKFHSSSESDADIEQVKHVKKKRKIDKSKSPSPESDGENKNGKSKSEDENADKNSHSDDSAGKKSKSSRKKVRFQ